MPETRGTNPRRGGADDGAAALGNRRSATTPRVRLLRVPAALDAAGAGEILSCHWHPLGPVSSVTVPETRDERMLLAARTPRSTQCG